MTSLWVDTDFGFDDLWALLLLRRFRVPIAGVSLVAGNAPLPQVAANALGAIAAYGFDWPVWTGAAQPLQRRPETAARVLGSTGMQSRGRRLPPKDPAAAPSGAVEALRAWLSKDTGSHDILALGPLTNIAHLVQQAPELRGQIARVLWMGGSAGAGNHTPLAEFNAVADAEALACVLSAGLRLDIVDLTFCRKVTFGEGDMPQTDALTGDLLGGYLDIARTRGRPGMAIYDPVAALALADPKRIGFSPCGVTVSTAPDETYGATSFAAGTDGPTRWATVAQGDLARLCLGALEQETQDGPRR